MVNFEVSAELKLTCDGCGKKDSMSWHGGVNEDFDSDLEIDDMAAELGWAVNGDSAVCPECLGKED